MYEHETKVFQDGGLQSGNWLRSGLSPQPGGCNGARTVAAVGVKGVSKCQ